MSKLTMARAIYILNGWNLLAQELKELILVPTTKFLPSYDPIRAGMRDGCHPNPRSPSSTVLMAHKANRFSGYELKAH
jgi:hypothetical protein